MGQERSGPSTARVGSSCHLGHRLLTGPLSRPQAQPGAGPELGAARGARHPGSSRAGGAPTGTAGPHGSTEVLLQSKGACRGGESEELTPASARRPVLEEGEPRSRARRSQDHHITSGEVGSRSVQEGAVLVVWAALSWWPQPP